MPSANVTIRGLALALALAGMFAGQLAAHAHTGDPSESAWACVDLCTFDGCTPNQPQPTQTNPTNSTNCDCVHAVAPKTTPPRGASRTTVQQLKVVTSPAVLKLVRAIRQEPLPSITPTPSPSHEILRTTIIQS
jgi:hypothetical protein